MFITGADIMYQQAYVHYWSGYNVPAGLCSLLERI